MKKEKMLLKAFINKEKKYECYGFCDYCIYKDINKTVAGCNPETLQNTVDIFIKENLDLNIEY